ncbi:Muscle M-line assembly protein unc-89 [Wickerhamomyces ciferrii]|uniref:Muscle M-line assembly protein unc-89 n=1 Tax=Wickerhamomyces ciferrii (strain ATCC 14091 / BCRC 22168 / CBS 111 / JCM 3599 / NBRC 0793 / NRRL Y-1031 F-60-10) TaxID=1206466 RepID=K0KEQ4_WICCF|nr:Muscle M-line assembly protein unc-89 [Wickerhamomyces ciferrii]CCH43615.1 Muscle M-line assembly protein unc-89 [Wickerhamomyces ciferrii]
MTLFTNISIRNPKLLLESPKKLRGSESPVKKIRDHALLLKSPLKDKTNITLSPIRYNQKQNMVKSPQDKPDYKEKSKSPIKPINLMNLGTSTILKPTTQHNDWLRKSQSPFLSKVNEQSDKGSLGLESSPSLEHLHHSTPSRGSSKTLTRELSHKTTEDLRGDHDVNLEDKEADLKENEYELFDKVEVEGKKETSKDDEAKHDSKSLKEPVKMFEFEQDNEPAKILNDDKLSDDDNDYDASMEDQSFQAIRKSIRRSILRKSKASEEVSTDISFKDALDNEPQQSSLVANQGSIATSRPNSKDLTNEPKTQSEPVVDKDEFTKSKTPTYQAPQPQPQHRKSQGFALLPHRDPLTVKSAKKAPPPNTNKGENKNVESQSASESPQEKLSPLVFKGLYPTISPQKDAQLGSSPSKIAKPKAQTAIEKSPSKSSVNDKKSTVHIESTKPLIHSPPNEKVVDSTKTTFNSPLSGLFASVHSSVKKVTSKFTRDPKAEKVKVDDKFKVNKKRKSSTGTSKKPNLARDDSPSKRIVSNSESIFTRLAAPTEASKAKSVKRVISGTSNALTESPIKANDDDFSSKLSPVKFNYEPLRFEMNKNFPKSPTKSPQKSPIKSLAQSPIKSPVKLPMKSPVKAVSKSPSKKSPTKVSKQDKLDEPIDQEESRKSYGLKPKNLTRMSLTKPKGDMNNNKSNNLTRKSLSKGLTSIPLIPSNKNLNKPRAKSFVGQMKRKTQSEDEIKTNTIQNQQKHQQQTQLLQPRPQPQPKKLITKVPPPSTNQKLEQDIKRQRTSEEARTMFKKRASRISDNNDHLKDDSKQQQQQQPRKPIQISNDDIPTHQQSSRLPPSNTKHSKYGPNANTSTLMRTAVIQHAKENNKNNPFQNGSINKLGNNYQSIPVTPKTPTVLPEIFSESEDDEEGVILKDWANTPELRDKLMKQRRIDPDQVFGPMAPLQMEDIFKNSRLSRFKHRGSSAQWVGQDALTSQEVENYKNKTYKK